MVINAKWTPTQSEAPADVKGETPEGAKCFLLKLPQGGIPAMTARRIKLYWTIVMRNVLEKPPF